MDEREMFEAWADQEGISVRRCTHLDDIYASPAARVAWRAWQIGRRNMPTREAIIEECATVCEQVAAARNIPEMRSGAELCVEAVRALKTAPTISYRDTLIEEIAEMVDHMGEGRRLDEYVGAIREMKGEKS